MCHRNAPSVVFAGILTLSCAAAAQDASESKPHRLDDRQRVELLSLIKQVDEAEMGNGLDVKPFVGLSSFVLKGIGPISYLPMTMKVDVPFDQVDQFAVYLRVVTRAGTAAPSKEESGIANWLAREAAAGAPRPAAIPEFFTVNPEEMPVGGGQMNSANSQGAQIQGSFTALALMEKENERNRVDKTQGTEKVGDKGPANEILVYPFEDFDFLSLGARTVNPQEVSRAVALPPGSYDLYLALVPHGGDKPKTPIQPVVYRERLDVSEPPKDLAMSSVILADRLTELATPYRPEEQSAHPYALGWTEAIPARDTKFDDAEHLGVVFQVLNPSPDEARKPDVTLEYSFFRLADKSEHLEASPRRDYNRSTLPAEFDLAKGHQLLVAQGVPLKNFPPGDYRLEIKATDRKTAKTVSSNVFFSVIASPNSVWVEQTVSAMLAPSFQPSDVLGPDLVGPALDRLATLQTTAPDQKMSSLLADARAERFAAILDHISAAEGDPTATAFLRGLALLGLNGNLDAAAAQFREAVRSSSDFLAASVYLGACYAAAGRDQDATGAWQLALSDEYSTPVLHLLMANAFLRLNDVPAALDVLKEARELWPDDSRVRTRTAAAHLIAHDDKQALGELDAVLAKRIDDTNALFLAIYLLNRMSPADRHATDESGPDDRLARYTRAYVAAHGPHAMVVEQWIGRATPADPNP